MCDFVNIFTLIHGVLRSFILGEVRCLIEEQVGIFCKKSNNGELEARANGLQVIGSVE